ncbi:MAG TPA: hypothetical protein VFY36_00915 [Solirubrobacteraceae bacterium]|nr:hypothetical protein [Solirubrobacteraceae bacterium]
MAIVAAFGVAMGYVILPAVSFASSAPLIGSLSAGVSQNIATLEAPIRPYGLETMYELWLEYPACQPGGTCEPMTSERVGEGAIPASRLEEVVSVELTFLKWDYFYSFVVIASNPAGTSRSYPLTFTTGSPPPPGAPGGSGVGAPYEGKQESWVIEGAERAAKEAPRIEEEEREAKKREEERPAKEAAARAAKEREIREAGERAGREAAEREFKKIACVVPRLKGDSLTAARRALAKGHCGLGKVSKPHKHRGALVVMAQTLELAVSSRTARVLR